MIRPLSRFNTLWEKIGVTCYKQPHRTSLNHGTPKPNLTFTPALNFHTTLKNHTKIFTDFENNYAYKLLPPISKFEPSLSAPSAITTLEAFDNHLNQNWRASTATAIVEAFERVKDITISHKITLSDKRFDKLVDGLMDHCEKLTDDELLRLLLTLLEYPPCDASNSRNFHDVWSCLDDICCWKMSNWDLQKLYTFADVWFRWNLGRLSDFVFEVLDRATFKPHRLSKNMLVYTFFYFNVNRRKSVPFEFEHELARRIDEFSIDEWAIIAMGYFKTKSKIKLPEIASAMIRAVSENCETINEISLTAILKALRLSQRGEVASDIPPMLDKVTLQLPRLSIMSLVHVALIGTQLQLKHEPSIRKCADRIIAEIETIRIKDLERILLACSMFSIDTTPSIYEVASKEILKQTRRKEFVQYNRCLPSILNYLSLRKIYSHNLMNDVLNDEYINETYGKSSKNVPRDLFSLDTCVEVECPDYKGNRLSPQKRYKAAKWLSEYAPTRDQHKRLSLSDKAYLEIVDSLVGIVGEERLLRSDHVLPHFSKPDIILCKDQVSGEFVEPFGFENYVLGDVMRPFNVEKYKWYAVMVLTPNLTLRDACEPLGGMIMKERQLKTIGYTPVLVYAAPFTTLSSAEKTAHLRRHLS
ncbi:FAST kinase domain-containing protein 5, mitochondrial [Zophobas morio]|uniref:FAST kinase domain-containing protein 5, mitochondrial n=1 Tax=Zophobas morio TaxID=2755281 RepID=UPI00308330CC